MPSALEDRAILEQIEHDVVQPSIIVKIVQNAVRLLHDPSKQSNARREVLEKELQQLKEELIPLTKGIAAGGTLQTLLGAVQEREARQSEIQAELALLNGVTVAPFDPKQAEEDLRQYRKDWSGLAQRHPAQPGRSCESCFPRSNVSGSGMREVAVITSPERRS